MEEISPDCSQPTCQVVYDLEHLHIEFILAVIYISRARVTDYLAACQQEEGIKHRQKNPTKYKQTKKTKAKQVNKN